MKADLIILGVLHRGDFHPYEIKRRIEAGLVDRLLDLDTGTLYYAVKQLAKEGCIEVRGEERVARGGARTIYGLTDRGRARFQELMAERFADLTPSRHPFYSALLFLAHADRTDFPALIDKRLAAYEQGLATSRAIWAHIGDIAGTGNRYVIEHALTLMQVEIDWLRRLRADIAEGRVQDSDMAALATRGMVPPGLEDLIRENGDDGDRG